MLSYILKRPIQGNATLHTANTAAFHKQVQVSAGLPVHLKIPKINIDAALDYVGITPQGALGVPGTPTNAAWYDQGPRPGEKGDAVIDGHSGWKNNIPAVFDNLHKLQKGDTLYVEDEKGVTTTFVVREVRTYGQNQDDSNVFVTSDKQAHLNLITCEGTWNEVQKSYSNRLVVFADKVT
jgi:LPXTG-site transpeptidase (sortase) family protein